MTEIENPNLSFDGLPRTIADLHTKIDRLTVMLEGFISSSETSSLPEIMTVEDVAAMLRKSLSTIYAMTSGHRIPYRKQGNKLYFLRSEINAWLTASTVPEDTPKRRRNPHEKRNTTDEMSSASECIKGANDVVNHSDMACSISEIPTENSIAEPKDEQGNSSYTIGQRTHTRNGTTIFAVLFSKEMEAAGERKFNQSAREHHGYWSDYGEGGYIFNTWQDAENFAKAITGKEGKQGA